MSCTCIILDNVFGVVHCLCKTLHQEMSVQSDVQCYVHISIYVFILSLIRLWMYSCTSVYHTYHITTISGYIHICTILYYDAYVQSYISIYSDCVISTTVHQCIICIGTMCILHQAVWYVQLDTRIPINKLTSSVHPLIDIVQWGGHHHYPTVSILFPSFLQVFQEKMG